MLSISPISSEFSWNARDNLLAKIYQTGARIESFQNSWSGWKTHLRVRWSRRTHLGGRLHCAQSRSFNTFLHYHSSTQYNSELNTTWINAPSLEKCSLEKYSLEIWKLLVWTYFRKYITWSTDALWRSRDTEIWKCEWCTDGTNNSLGQVPDMLVNVNTSKKKWLQAESRGKERKGWIHFRIFHQATHFIEDNSFEWFALWWNYDQLTVPPY